MKRRIFPFFIIAAVVVVGLALVTPAFMTSAYADCGGASTVLIGCDSGSSNSLSGIDEILKLILNILTVLVGILATIGIVISGLQYLTAGDRPEQVRKAKRRIFEIILGLIAYALIYAALQWLMPSGSPVAPGTGPNDDPSNPNASYESQQTPAGGGEDDAESSDPSGTPAATNRDDGSEQSDDEQGRTASSGQNEGWNEQQN